MDNDQDRNYSNDRETEKHPEPSHHASGGGISNRPDDEERENQERLPPRGQEKAGD
jgi:hypothetical protein